MAHVSRRDFLLTSAAAVLAGCADGRPVPVVDSDTPVATVAEGEGRFAVAGGEAWYTVMGSGPGAPLVAAHGGPGFSHDYLMPLAELGSDRPVILYDQLDCGNSARPGAAANWTVSRFVSEIESLRTALGLTRFHLLGHAWGGALAVEYAAASPGRVLSCVLASPLINSRRWTEDNLLWRRLLPDPVQRTLDEHEAAGTTGSDAYQAAMQVFYDRHLCRVSPWPEPLLASLKKSNADLYVSMWGENEFFATGTLRSHDGTVSLPRIAAPVLFTGGEFDEAPPATLYRYARLVNSAADVRVITDASHMPHLEQTGAYLQALRVFFGAIG